MRLGKAPRHRPEWSGLILLALACLLVSFDSQALNLAIPKLTVACFGGPRSAWRWPEHPVVLVLYGSQLWIAQYLQVVLGLSPLRAGGYTIPSVLGYLLGATIAPAAAKRLSPHRARQPLLRHLRPDEPGHGHAGWLGRGDGTAATLNTTKQTATNTGATLAMPGSGTPGAPPRTCRTHHHVMDPSGM